VFQERVMAQFASMNYTRPPPAIEDNL